MKMRLHYRWAGSSELRHRDFDQHVEVLVSGKDGQFTDIVDSTNTLLLRVPSSYVILVERVEGD